jgi:hypothetical protein
VFPLATSRLLDGVRRSDIGFVHVTCIPRGMWRVQRPFGRGIPLPRASRSSSRDGGMPPVAGFPASGLGPCHRPVCPVRHGGQAQPGEGRFCLLCRHGLGDAFLRTVWQPSSSGRTPIQPPVLPVILNNEYAVRGLIPAAVAELSDSSPP